MPRIQQPSWVGPRGAGIRGLLQGVCVSGSLPRTWGCPLLPPARGAGPELQGGAGSETLREGGGREEEKTCHVLPENTISDRELMRGLCGISIYISQSDFPRQKDTNRTLRDQSL